MGKTKLTLSINSEVVEKAKRVGVNLSQLAEQTFEILADPTLEDVTKEYQNALEKMLPNMQKHNFSLCIGKFSINYVLGETRIYYEPDGNFSEYTSLGTKLKTVSLEKIAKEQGFELADFSGIITDYLEKLGNAIEKNKQKLQQVKTYTKIIEAINEGLK